MQRLSTQWYHEVYGFLLEQDTIECRRAPHNIKQLQCNASAYAPHQPSEDNSTYLRIAPTPYSRMLGNKGMCAGNQQDRVLFLSQRGAGADADALRCSRARSITLQFLAVQDRYPSVLEVRIVFFSRQARLSKPLLVSVKPHEWWDTLLFQCLGVMEELTGKTIPIPPRMRSEFRWRRRLRIPSHENPYYRRVLKERESAPCTSPPMGGREILWIWARGTGNIQRLPQRFVQGKDKISVTSMPRPQTCRYGEDISAPESNWDMLHWISTQVTKPSALARGGANQPTHRRKSRNEW